jgi:hypothetical protein
MWTQISVTSLIHKHMSFLQLTFARGDHSIVKLNTTCKTKKSNFYIKHHQNGSKYQLFSCVDIHGIYHIVKIDNQIK